MSAYFDLSRGERFGVAALLLLLLLLTVARFAMVSIFPGADVSQNDLTAAWERQKSANETAAMGADTIIDLNTADSLTLVSLRGIGPKIAHYIIEGRAKAGSFKNYGEVWALYHFNAETRKELLTKTRLAGNQQ